MRVYREKQLLFFSSGTNTKPQAWVLLVPQSLPSHRLASGDFVFLGRGTHWKSNSPSKASSRHRISKHIYKTGSFILLYLVASWPSSGSQVPPGHNNKPVASERCLRSRGPPANANTKAPLVSQRHPVRQRRGSISLGLCRSFLTGLPASGPPAFAPLTHGESSETPSTSLPSLSH